MSWGYLGKVPSRGDFLTQNLAPEARDLLFEWCQSGMAVSREQLGGDWLDAYLTAPIWHFSAGPGVFLEEGVIGTFIPSVDRVGRHFPFMVVAPYGGTGIGAWRQAEWASQMEDCVLAVLDDGWDEAAWSARLLEIEPPAPVPARLRWPPAKGNLVLPGAAGEEDWLTGLLGGATGPGVWWTQGSAYVEPSTLLTEGLPKVGQFAGMLAGRWQEFGWQQALLEE